MMIRTYWSVLLRSSLLLAACGLALASCGKKTDVTTEAPKSQVVAKIGNEVVTVQELDNEFRLGNVTAEKRKDPATIKRVLGELVLANALASRDVTTKSSSISKADIDNYIANNPLKFANRQAMSVEQISFPLSSTSQAVIEATKEMKTLDEVDQKLTGMGVQHGRSAGAISSGDLPQDLLNMILAKQADDIFFIRSGVNGVFFKVTGRDATQSGVK